MKSAFTQIVGRRALDLSSALFWISVFGVIASYVIGVVVSVKGRNSADEGQAQSSGLEDLGEDLGDDLGYDEP
ncbi:hypothetical protein [uncultured Corynebacterium sp.]|uniref:hypothetical protein n=1 Tax=uncultured Corynebacterium sp. TaxID=159447 RepID=UPI0025EF6620|nr:hypothetical protein [uncultured Corynebacterium sp.]